jgi:hypothetical protein
MLAKTINPKPLFILMAIGIAAAGLMAAQTPAKGPIQRFTATTDNVSGAGDTVKIDLLSWSTDADRDQFLAAWNLTAPPGGARGGAGRGAAGGAGAAGGRGAGGGRGADAPAAAGARGQDTPPADADAAAGARGGGGGRGGRGAAAGAAPAAASTPEGSLSAALQAASTIGYLWTSESTGYSLRYAYRLPQPDGSERIILATDRRLGAWNNLWKPTGSAAPTDYEFTLIELRLSPKGEGVGKASLTGKVAVDSASNTIALDGYDSLPVVFKGVKKQ